jgi:mannose-1-phosphate guanylyltransferase/mannose-6-phosphate isomerase
MKPHSGSGTGKIMKSIILAGGVGTRLWPLSREYYPKQFIQLDGHSLFQRTYERATLLSDADGIFVVTNKIHQYLARNQIEEMGFAIQDDHLLAEPEGKNTLPAIAWAMQRIRSISSSATAVVFPSDHLLGENALDQIRAAEPLSAKNIVTFGIKPDSPHTGYGYIKPGRPLPYGALVAEFREKPDEKIAEEYVRNGYLWNSGIFLLSVGSFFSELKKYRPELFEAFREGNIPDYAQLESISIDYGLLEQSKKVAVVTLETEWSDLGTFKALYEVEQHDQEGNLGKAEYVSSENNFVHAPGKHVGLIGVRDLIVVDTPDALLVCDRKHSEMVKQLVTRYNKRNDPVTKFHRQVHRP